MNEDYHWQEKNYDEVFKAGCKYIDDRKKDDKDFTISDLEKMIQALYVRRGNDWVGKGPVKNIEDSATIAAFEHKLAEWKKELEFDK